MELNADAGTEEGVYPAKGGMLIGGQLDSQGGYGVSPMD